MTAGSTTAPDCLICEQVAAAGSLPGGPLFGDESVVAYHLPPIERFPRQYLGRVLVVTRRHVDLLGDLTEEEAVSVGLAARRVARALQALEDVARVHLALIGMGVPHFHLHVFPRYAWMPRDADWNALHLRHDAPLGAETEIAAFVARLRTHV